MSDIYLCMYCLGEFCLMVIMIMQGKIVGRFVISFVLLLQLLIT